MLRHISSADVGGSVKFALVAAGVVLSETEDDAAMDVLGVDGLLSGRESLLAIVPLRGFFFFVMLRQNVEFCEPRINNTNMCRSGLLRQVTSRPIPVVSTLGLVAWHYQPLAVR